MAFLPSLPRVSLSLLLLSCWHARRTCGGAEEVTDIADGEESGASSASGDDGSSSYTVFDDRTWAVRSNELSPHTWNRQAAYDEFMEQCREYYQDQNVWMDLLEEADEPVEVSPCDIEESDRLDFNYLQPESVRNFTKTGFVHLQAPGALYQRLREFFEANQGQDLPEFDLETKVSTVHNGWLAPTTILQLENRSLVGGDPMLKTFVANQMRPYLQEWTGQRLALSSVYGMRLYHDGSVLAPHVDRMPHIAAAIINVAQDVEEDWPLEVYGHDTVACNISMKPGDMVLYESHSILHGRPFALRGNYYANVMVFFEPLGPLSDTEPSPQLDGDMPPYIIPGTAGAEIWWDEHPDGWQFYNDNTWRLAQRGDVEVLTFLARSKPGLLTQPDSKGYQPIHHACKIGQLDVVKFLVESGGETVMNAGDYSPLGVAENNLGNDHVVAQYLADLGAVSRGGRRNRKKPNTTAKTVGSSSQSSASSLEQPRRVDDKPGHHTTAAYSEQHVHSEL